MNKKQLYESIMRAVSQEVKKALLNEKLSDYRAKYNGNSDDFAAVYDKIVEILKEFKNDKSAGITGTFGFVTLFYGNKSLSEDVYNVSGENIYKKYHDGFNLSFCMNIQITENAYKEYAAATTKIATNASDKRRLLSVIDGDKQDDNTIVLYKDSYIHINITNLAKQQSKQDKFFEWLKGDMEDAD